MRVGSQKQVLSFPSSFGSFGVRNCFFYLVVGLLVGKYHDTATSGTFYSDLRNFDNSCSGCVGKHVTISRHCQFCARLGDGRSTVGSGALARGSQPWQDNGKELMRRQPWDRGLDRTHLQVSQRQHWRTHTDNGNAIFNSGKQPHRCRRTGREDGSWDSSKGESRTAAEVVMDDLLVQDDGIDLIVEELDRCFEVHARPRQSVEDRKGPPRDTQGRQNGDDLHVLRGTEEA